MYNLSTKNFILFTVLLFNVFTISAQNKYPSLLWKIEGENLKKPSYLYGTMHVSSKIAFNLGDEFFDALSDVDAVALETNPELWLGFYRGEDFNAASDKAYNRGNSYTSYGFYNNFLTIPYYSMNSFQTLLSPEDQMLNQLLYRYNYGEENYEETTYLDMFLYQSARKEGKKIFSLEDFLESFFLARRSNLPDEDDEDESYGNQRIAGEELSTAYLERNLDMIDSLISENFSNNYRKYLLDIRNENMVVAMDSLMPDLSLFSGVGAAHLPGKNGMIELLRKRGYTVTAVKFDKSKKASKTFKKMKRAAVDVPTQKHVSKDGRISLTSIGEFYPENQSKRGDISQTHFLPDFANGAYYSYERLLKYPYGENFRKKGGLDYIDSILYLITPGEIDRQKNVTVGNYKALEVTSELSRNNYLKQLIVDTPQEIIVFKTSGNKSFIKSKNVKNYFKSIKVKEQSTAIDLAKLGITLDLPEHSVLAHEYKGNVLIVGTDASNTFYKYHSEYMFDYNDLEEDAFELKYLVEEFAEEAEYEVDTMTLEDKKVTATLKNEDGDVIHIHYRIHHNFYYQLITDASAEKANAYFNSFEINSPNYSDHKVKKEIEDELHYSFESYYTSTLDTMMFNEFKSLREDYETAESFKDSLDRTFEGEFKVQMYKDPVTGTGVLVRHSRLNKYYTLNKGIEDFKDRVNLKYNKDSLFYSPKILNETQTDTSFQIEYQYSKEGTGRVLHYLETIAGDEYITVVTNYDTTLTKPTIVSQILSTFEVHTPSDESNYILHSKGQMYLEHLTSDTYQLKQQAKESIGEVYFDEATRADLEAVLLNDTLEILEKDDFRIKLLSAYSRSFNETEGYLNFLKSFYDKFKNDVGLQLAALRGISNVGTSESTAFFMDAIEKHPPMTNSQREIGAIFSVFADSSHLVEPILPRLEQFALDYEEFLPRVVYLIDRGNFNDVFSTNVVSDKFLDKLEKIATQNLRKMRFAKEESKSDYNELVTEMIKYGSVFSCYDKDEVRFKDLFEKLDTITDKRFKANFLAKRINRRRPFTINELEEIMNDTTYIYPFFTWLEGTGFQDSVIKMMKPSKELIYYSYILDNADYNTNKDSLKFHSKVSAATYKESGDIYIYQTETNYGTKKLIAVYFIDPEKPFTSEVKKSTWTYDNEDELEDAIESLVNKAERKNRVRFSSGYYY